MSFFSDLLDFEKFQLGDWWDKIKDNPEQLLIGAGDPFSAGLWSGITGKDYEPFVNALGGPMGGDTLGIGSGGVYDRAQAAGVDTGAATKMHDAAEVIASYYGGKGLLDLAGGIGGGGGDGGLLGSGESGGMFDFSSMDWSSPQTYMDLMQMMPQGGGMGGQQQQVPQGPPPMARPSGSAFLPQPHTLPSQAQPRENRAAIIGLLGLPEDVTDEQMQAILGGIL